VNHTSLPLREGAKWLAEAKQDTPTVGLARSRLAGKTWWDAAMKLFSIVILTMLSTVASADDRGDCGKGDEKACARIGRLKQLGALKADGTRDTDKLVEVCGKTLEAAKTPTEFTSVARSCGLLFSELQKAWDALAAIEMSGVDAMLATGYAESYCPALAKPVAGCNGKKAANFSGMKHDKIIAALSALNGAALDKELGTVSAEPRRPGPACRW
jgi:hypothetical protein